MRKRVIWVLVLIVLGGCSSKKQFIEPTNHSVYYEIFVASFYDSDGDGVGDIQGIIEKLDYIQYDIGASSIWFMPINPSPTYHKYDVVDYYEIDEAYGTLDEFKQLIEELDKRNMTLIMDLVLNHTSSEHPWFKSSLESMKNDSCTGNTYCTYYNYTNQLEKGYTKVNDNLYYESVFWSEMPDLNLDNPEVRTEIEAISKYWLDLGVDGFRLDATTHYYAENTQRNVEFLSWFKTMVSDINPNAYIVGEAWSSKQVIFDMYESGIDSFFNFSFSGHDGTLINNINEENGVELAHQILDYNHTLKDINVDAIDAVFISNHDTGRSAGYLTTLDKQKLVASIYLLMPGNVFIYYGEEIGMTGSGKDENKRLALPWGTDKGLTNNPIGYDYTKEQSQTVEKSINDSDSLLNHYHNVIQVRNTYPEIVEGNFKVIEIQKELMVMEYESIIIVHNLSDSDLNVTLNGTIETILNGSASTSDETLSISGKSSVVLKK